MSHIPITRTIAFYNSFLPSTVKLWNTLPNSLKSATSIAKFKQGLQNNNPVDKIKSKLYNHGQRNLNILHCQLKFFSSNLNAALYNHNLVESFVGTVGTHMKIHITFSFIVNFIILRETLCLDT